MHKKGERGFSATEIVVVAGIIGLFCLLLVPSLASFFPRLRFESTARQLASDIALQRLRAIERRETTSISYNASSRTYTLAPYGIRRELPPEVVAAAIPTIQFNSRGINPSGCAVTITLTGQRTLSRTILVSPAGRVKSTP
jgi:Tfp pilus assembly protein FimT